MQFATEKARARDLAECNVEARLPMTTDRIGRLPARAIVCNTPGERSWDEPAPVAALQDGRLRGAVLDAFSTEPLASESPLWQLPRVLHTPHVAVVSPGRLSVRLTSLFFDNGSRYRHGEPMRNLVDRQAGY